MKSPNPAHVLTFTDSQISHASWSPDTNSLTIKFTSGPTYTHNSVSPELFAHFKQWTDAGYSPGKFYHSHIKSLPLAQS